MYARILVPVDGSETAERGLREALSLAAELKSQLVLLYVVDDYPLMVDLAASIDFEQTRREMVKFGEQVLDKARKQATEVGVPAERVVREATSLRAAEVIVEEAGQRGCALIAMGTHGRRGFNRLAMGSDAEMVLRDAPVPVLLVRYREPQS